MRNTISLLVFVLVLCVPTKQKPTKARKVPARTLASLLDVSEVTIWRWSKGKLPRPRKLGSNTTRFNGKNNGRLQLSFSWVQGRGWKLRDVIQRARDEIIERGLLIQTRQGAEYRRISLCGDRLHISNFVGLEIQGKDYHPGAWGFMDSLPVARRNASTSPPNGKGNPASRHSPAPTTGTGEALAVP